MNSFDEAIAASREVWGRVYGSASELELCTHYARALELSAGTHEPLGPEAVRRHVEREHVARYGAERLAAEAADERQRDAAVTDDAALVLYERKWTQRLTRLQRAHPRRWRVEGWSELELRDELTLRLIDALRARTDELSRHRAAGKEWGLLFLAHERRSLERDFRLKVVLTEPPAVLERGPTGEERLLEDEHENLLALARERAESTLSRPQRSWYAAMRLTASAGAFFEASGNLNLSEVSRTCGKNRSSATRAFAELKTVFTRELTKLGG